MELGRVARFLFEVGMLRRLERSGFQFLGSGRQSVADHSFRVACIGYVLSGMEKGIDDEKVLKICLFHDLCESRTGDLNYVHKRYVKADEVKAASDMAQGLSFGPEIREIIEEFSLRATAEARLANDADQLDLILELKEQHDLGIRYASEWIPYVKSRLLTENGRNLAHAILETDWAAWWFTRDDDWLVNGEER